MKKIFPAITASLLCATFIGPAFAADPPQEQQKELLEKQQDAKEMKQGVQKEEEKTSTAANVLMQQMSRASSILGTSVTNSKGENLGGIKDLVLNPETGQVAYVVLSHGGMLGMGDKLFAISWKALQWKRDKENYVLDMDKATFEKATGFDEKHWPDSSSKWDQQYEELKQFYRVKP